jgi:predicted permease
MCRRYIRWILLVIGSALVLFAALPVLAFLHFGEYLQTELMASKLILLPVGAICLIGFAILGRHEVRH